MLKSLPRKMSPSKTSKSLHKSFDASGSASGGAGASGHGGGIIQGSTPNIEVVGGPVALDIGAVSARDLVPVFVDV